MKLTRPQHVAFSKGYQAQHDDMFADLKEYFSTIQSVMLNYENYRSMETSEDFEHFGQQAFLYKLEQYCTQARTLRAMQGLSNLYEKRCRHKALEHIVSLNGDEYDYCPICNYSKKDED